MRREVTNRNNQLISGEWDSPKVQINEKLGRKPTGKGKSKRPACHVALKRGPMSDERENKSNSLTSEGAGDYPLNQVDATKEEGKLL